MLIVVFGLPGTGKTTFGKLLAHRLQGIHLNSDVIRTIIGLRGHYDAESKQKVYEELLTETESQLIQGRTVILDASFFRRNLRLEVSQIAQRVGKPVCWIELQASEGSIKKRVSKPRPDSEADFAVYQLLRSQFEPMEEDHLILISDRESIEDMLDRTLEYLQKKESLPK